MYIISVTFPITRWKISSTTPDLAKDLHNVYMEIIEILEEHGLEPDEIEDSIDLWHPNYKIE